MTRSESDTRSYVAVFPPIGVTVGLKIVCHIIKLFMVKGLYLKWPILPIKISHICTGK